MISGNANKAEDSRGGPDESYLFSLTVVIDRGIGLSSEAVDGLGKAVAFSRFGAPSKLLENSAA